MLRQQKTGVSGWVGSANYFFTDEFWHSFQFCISLIIIQGH
jgi:hypothetical protein